MVNQLGNKLELRNEVTIFIFGDLNMEYDIVRNQPVAKFFYKGTHSHPIRRTVLVTEQSGDVLKGYEVREGTTLRDVEDAPIKSFRKDKIAMTNQLRGSKASSGKTTLERYSINEAANVGL
jgi:hypothetical protein